MGHSEIICEICGVSFAIARIRTPKEPPTAAWDIHGSSRGGFVTCYAPEDSEIPDEEFGEEYLEESSGCMIAVRPHRANSDGNLLPPSQHPEEEMYFDQIRANPEEHRPEILERLRKLEDEYCLEHVAGPECNTQNGYNGHMISLEEMKTCTTMQGLVTKPARWESEDGDEEFEKSGRYFLSGLVDSITTIDGLYSEVSYPKRHGCDEIFPVRRYIEIAEDRFQMDYYSIPIHPACLETFKRATLHRYNHIDVGAFTQWWERDDETASRSLRREDKDVTASSSQWWQHIKGLEYLAANPCFVPTLSKIFSHMTVDIEQQGKKFLGEDTEIFAGLPSEIRSLIFDHLSLDEISNLQLASPFLHRYSQNDLRRRLVQEWPWFWEAWTDLKYSTWVGKTARELRESVEPSVQPVIVSNRDIITWGSIFRLISRERTNGGLKGLQNRERIWRRSARILDKVEELRSDVGRE